MTVPPRHPAKFSAPILELLADLLDYYAVTGEVLDPFAGVGLIHELASDTRRTYGVELEGEWASNHPYTEVGDACRLPAAWGDRFAAVVTSPPYGNRFADSYDGRDGSQRHTYRIDLGRPLTEGSAAGMQWGRKYRRTMRQALAEMFRVTSPGGLLLLNISDHVRKHEFQGVPAWYELTARTMGFETLAEWPIETHRNHHTADKGALRAAHEVVYVFRKPLA